MNIEEEAYHALKIMLTKVVIAQPPDWTKPFHVFVDTSDIVIGSTLMKLIEPSWYRPIYFTSHKRLATERNYSTTECEAFGMIYNINKFRYYLLGRKFVFHVDHVLILGWTSHKQRVSFWNTSPKGG